MKIRGAKAVHYDSGPNMTPLVDVVMVILIFLMLAGTFAGAEHYLVSNLPFRTNGGGGAPTSAVPDDPPLTINIDTNATHDGYIARVDQYQATDRDRLAAVLTTLRDKLAAVGQTPDKVQVIISPGAGVRYKYVTEVFETAQSLNFAKIGFSTGH
ncbi:MAG: biopolymer transporter ExbD [Phycisphaerae bacterium]|nr:biopolymer transporter ExbD [Phycisphaerae bacterium]